MTISPDLRIVIPIQWDADGKPSAFAYHIPISTQVFEQNYRVIAATKSALFGKDLAYAYQNGARIAALELRDAARLDEEGGNEGSQTRAEALLAEITRLTTVLSPTAGVGFQSLMVDLAVKQGQIDPDDWSEALSGLVFFTSAYSMANRRNRARVAESMALVLTGSITSLSPTDYLGSLSTSTTLESSAAAPSSIPS